MLKNLELQLRDLGEEKQTGVVSETDCSHETFEPEIENAENEAGTWRETYTDLEWLTNNSHLMFFSGREQ
jgi:hypothetical protein